jgi:hypothetical protein
MASKKDSLTIDTSIVNCNRNDISNKNMIPYFGNVNEFVPKGGKRL